MYLQLAGAIPMVQEKAGWMFGRTRMDFCSNGNQKVEGVG